MHTKIIPFHPQYGKEKKQTDTTGLTDAAWNFAYTILWYGQQFTNEEIERAKFYLHQYFKEAANKKKAFTAFCERIILTNKYISAQPQRYVPAPSVWLNRHYQHGFAGTKSWYQQVEAKRSKIPGYLKHISIMARHYYLYCFNQSASAFHSCRKKLLALNAKILLQQFCNVIVHYNYPI